MGLDIVVESRKERDGCGAGKRCEDQVCIVQMNSSREVPMLTYLTSSRSHEISASDAKEVSVSWQSS